MLIVTTSQLQVRAVESDAMMHSPAFAAGQRWVEQANDYEQLRRVCVDLSLDDLPNDSGDIEQFLMGARSVWNEFASKYEPKSVVPLDFSKMSVQQRRVWASCIDTMLARRAL